MSSQTRRFDEKEKAETIQPKTNPFYMGFEQARVAIHITNVNLQLVFDLSKPLVLGRSHMPRPNVTFLDLTPFRAEELGVSRRHLTMKLDQKKLVAIDHGSLNGTYINDKLIEPETAYIVSQGDRLSVARLHIRIDFITDFSF